MIRAAASYVNRETYVNHRYPGGRVVTPNTRAAECFEQLRHMSLSLQFTDTADGLGRPKTWREQVYRETFGIGWRAHMVRP